ncbi:MAG: RIP metalloprotease RseP [Omnitrophica WOR_2 bacterium RIFCSPLOWO2_12_FULL_50_9]|nr:MAG: RIP metalloprotease RseP [Omnitrophica WOR_2 bacterium RIFCSPHIGHO2_02_FULL_50_17]OGX43503.1 MAG: RIP metalloprotease RseP [Omnitrophica WOR_2 bacterium RIFCSPLOWO2_12_FULL_50_9]
MEVLIANLQSTLIFILVLSVLILVHEWGHFITAKRLGVGVERFALGFGPTIYSRMYKGTRYLINIIPLGGYVKMAGDERSQCQGRPEEFYSKPVGHRALVILNGPLVNFIFAYVCLFFVFMLGYPDLSNKIGEVIEGYPAYEAGLQAGDQVVSVDSRTIESWSGIQEAVTTSSTPQIELTVLREGREITKMLAPKIEEIKTIFGKYKTVRLIGIRPSEEIVSLKYGMGTAFLKAYQELAKITTMTYKAMFSILTGSMSAKENLTGPIGIFYIIKKAAEMGMSHLLFILGVISASLAIFNLLPVIPLDGGHLFLLVIEKVRGHALPPRVDEYIVKVGFTLLVFMALFVFYSDFARFGWIDKLKQLFP